jgi:hypothetical protein
MNFFLLSFSFRLLFAYFSLSFFSFLLRFFFRVSGRWFGLFFSWLLGTGAGAGTG